MKAESKKNSLSLNNKTHKISQKWINIFIYANVHTHTHIDIHLNILHEHINIVNLTINRLIRS